jgi:hypothetical protein
VRRGRRRSSLPIVGQRRRLLRGGARRRPESIAPTALNLRDGGEILSGPGRRGLLPESPQLSRCGEKSFANELEAHPLTASEAPLGEARRAHARLSLVAPAARRDEVAEPCRAPGRDGHRMIGSGLVGCGTASHRFGAQQDAAPDAVLPVPLGERLHAQRVRLGVHPVGRSWTCHATESPLGRSS